MECYQVRWKYKNGIDYRNPEVWVTAVNPPIIDSGAATELQKIGISIRTTTSNVFLVDFSNEGWLKFNDDRRNNLLSPGVRAAYDLAHAAVQKRKILNEYIAKL